MGSRVAFLVSAATACSVGWIAFSLGSRGHPFVLPLDDAYIYLQFARTAAQGSPGAYFPGGEAVPAFTSPIWAAVLALFAAILRVTGADLQSALPVAALVACTTILAGTIWLALRLAARLEVRLWAVPFPLVICLTTPLWIFGSLNGMETGLYSLALVGGAWVLVGGSLGWLVLLALARPEGAVLALGILGWRMWLGPARNRDPRSRWFLPGLVAMAALLTIALPWIWTGHASSAWAAKSLWMEPKEDVRNFYLPRLPYFAGRTLWFGLSGARPQPPLDLAGAVLRPGAWPIWLSAIFLGGGALLALARRPARGVVILWIVASLAALVAVAWDAHFYRYLVPAYLLLVIAATAGWFAAPSGRFAAPAGRFDASTSRFDAPAGRPTASSSRTLRTIGLATWAAAVLGSFLAPRNLGDTVRWLYRGECERLESTQLRVGEWIAGHLPADAQIATHDVGAIAFASQRPVVDLVGLVTPALSGAYRHGEGALWESLDALPADERPTHAAVIPAWMPYLARTGLFAERLFAMSPQSSGRTSMGQTFEAWRLSWPGRDPARWPEGDFANRPRLHGPAAGRTRWQVTDRVDVGDIASEHRHGYDDPAASGVTVVRELGFGLPSEVSQASAIDGGRDVTGPVEFSVVAEPGLPALLILRATGIESVGLRVEIGGWTGELRLPRGESAFHETTVLIPAEVTDASPGGALRIRIEGSGYRAFHWWLLQSSDAEEIESTRD